MGRHLSYHLTMTKISRALAILALCGACTDHSETTSDLTQTAKAIGASEAIKTPVAVLGMIHDGHLESPSWGLDQVRETIRRFDPDVVCAEIPPGHWPRTLADWQERQVVEDSRVKRFPEYTDVLLPLMNEMSFEVVPCAAWTEEMAAERRERLQRFEEDPEQAENYAEYLRRKAEVERRHAADVIDEDDPRVIHSKLYDRRTAESLAPYDEMLNDWIGAGGWTHINEAHFALIEQADQ